MAGKIGDRDKKETFEECLNGAREKPQAYYSVPLPGGGECQIADIINGLGLGYGFAVGNVFKYLVRAGRKPGGSALTDLLKAQTYLALAINLLAPNDESEG